MNLPLRLEGQVSPDGLRRLSVAMAEAMDGADISLKARYRVELIVEEILTNLVKYTDAADARVEVLLEQQGDDLAVSIFDSGAPFDPQDVESPERPTRAEDIAPGGLGLDFVRKSAERLDYTQAPDGRNCLRAVVAG